MSHLSLEVICAKALEIIDQEGIENLSMRHLGKALHVDAKAIYYYIPGKDELIHAVLQAAFAQVTLPEQHEDTWQARLRQLAHAYYGLISQHPNLLPYLLRFDASIPFGLTLIERIAAALKPTGLSARSIAQIIDLFQSYIPSFAFDATSTTDEQSLYATLKMLDKQAFPATTALLEPLSEAEMKSLDANLDFQITIVLWGIEHLIEQETRP